MAETATRKKDSVWTGALLMVVISLLLFWVPVVNGLIGGLVGGWKVGSVGRALTAAVLPAVVVAVGLWVIIAVIDAPLLGFVAGVALGLWILFSDLGLFLGAAAGGAIAQSGARA